MDRQGKIAVAIAIIVLLGWQVYTVKNYKPPVPPPAAQASASAVPADQATAAPSAGIAAENNKQPVVPTEETVAEKTEKVSTPSVDYIFTNLGGGISKAMLHKHTAEDDKLVTLNEFGESPIGALSDDPDRGMNAAYTVTSGSESGTIICERTTPNQIQITKKYTLPKLDKGKDEYVEYVVMLDVSFSNRGDKAYRNPGYYVGVGSAAPIHEKDFSMYIGFDWYRNGKATDINVNWFSGSKIPIIGSAPKASYTAESDNIGWAGTYNQYFTSIVTPVGGSASKVWASHFPVDLATHTAGAEWLRKNPNATAPWYAIDGALGMPGFEIKPGETVSRQFRIYAGPRQYQLLKQLDGGESEILQFGMFGFVSKILLSAMNHVKPFVGSYAMAIIALTLIIKGLLWPMQNKATQSMKRMQALSPKMTEIREKYKDDPTRMNQEMMKLYKDYGINPFGGCLPMFIQLPVFFGFYRMLGTAIELRNSKFFWVQDLSQPDTVFHMAIPGLMNVPVNILPLCMAATNVWMMALSPKSGDNAQQRMMMFMPLIFLFICYNYASGLALYMMVGNLFSVAQLYLTRNQTAPVPQKLAVAKKKR